MIIQDVHIANGGVVGYSKYTYIYDKQCIYTIEAGACKQDSCGALRVFRNNKQYSRKSGFRFDTSRRLNFDHTSADGLWRTCRRRCG